MKHILLIEDERSIADTVCYALQTEGFSVEWKNLGREGVAYSSSLQKRGMQRYGWFQI